MPVLKFQPSYLLLVWSLKQVVLRATIVFQNDEHNRYWQVKSLCDTPLWCTATYLSLIHTLTSDFFIKMCVSVDYSITAWDNHDINESKRAIMKKTKIIYSGTVFTLYKTSS